MRRYTTPTIELTVEGVDLTPYEVWVSFRQGKRTVLDTNEATVEVSGEDTVITVPLTQLQTAGFQVGTAKVQVNWKDDEGNRNATVIGTIPIEANLLEEVL